jgi:hypothetical protein
MHVYREELKGAEWLWARVPHTERRKNVHINMWPETFNLWIIDERILSWHISRAVRDVLNNTYHDRWIGRGGPTAWPPRSPDLNPLYFYLWGHLNTHVYALLLTLHHRTVDACQTIRNCHAIFGRMRRSMVRRIEACIESHGGHFEHLL